MSEMHSKKYVFSLAFLSVLFLISVVVSVISNDVTADATIVYSGSIWCCDWELDSDGNLLMVCKDNSLRFDWIFDDGIPKNINTLSFDISKLENDHSFSFDGYGCDAKEIRIIGYENKKLDRINISSFPNADDEHISFPQGATVAEVRFDSLPVKSLNCLNGTGVSSLRLSNCNEWNGTSIPSSVKTLSFYDCPGVKEFVVPDFLENLYLDCMPDLPDFDIPANLKFLCWGEYPRKEITIPNVSCDIQIYRSFVLEKAVIEDGRKEINSKMFDSCRALSEVVIPESVTTIGEEAFLGCDNLKTVKLPDTLTIIGKGAFQYSGIETIVIPSGVKRLEEDIFCYCEELKSVTLPDSLEFIGSLAFYNTAIEEIQIPSGVELICYYAFNSCRRLSSVTIPEGVTNIDAAAFASCTSLEEIHLPDSVERLGYGVFSGCTKLKKINIPGSIQEIGSCAFKGTSIETFVIPSGVAEMGSCMFQGCGSLKTVIIPESVTSITADAFKDCYSLSDVYFEGSRYQWESIATPAHVIMDPNYEVISVVSVNSIYEMFTDAEIHFNSSGPGKWIRDSKGWWYQYLYGSYPASKWEQIKGSWYYFDASGYMVTGWKLLNGKWYRFNSVGQMQTGWVCIDGSWYYLEDSGAMVTGWKSIKGKWYRFNSVGVMQTGWVCVDGLWYYLENSGAMATGWKNINGEWYRMNSVGVMQTGWVSVDGKWYYLYVSGKMAHDTTIDGYRLNSSGAWVS